MTEQSSAYVPTGEIDKRRVTMTEYLALPPEEPGGPPRLVTRQAVDFVRPDILDAYVADAQTRWASVEVSEEPDAGPAGYEGTTYVPEALDHPLAGQTFPGTDDSQEG